MSKHKILGVAKALPSHSRKTEEILPFVKTWLEGEDQRFIDKAIRIFRYAEVEERYSILSPEEVFTATSFEEKNDIFIREMKILTSRALQKALDVCDIPAANIDYIITTSCTGIMIPSIDAYLVNELQMKEDIIRLPVTEMGCAGGTSALIYADRFLRSDPGKYAAVIAFESPTSTFQLQDHSMTNIVSSAIFGDGVSCAILGPAPEGKTLPVIRDSSMFHYYDEISMMGFRMRNTGFEMVLDPEVPEKIKATFGDIIHPFLNKNELEIKDLKHFVFHPGGKKIVQIVDELLSELGQNIDITREVLRQYGNMSSATVLYVLEEFMNKDIPEGDLGMMLSFGPGFTAQRLLLEWR